VGRRCDDERVSSEYFPDTAEAEFMNHLQHAHESAQKALDQLYGFDRAHRSLWYRMRLQRAQNALISMYVRDMKRKRGPSGPPPPPTPGHETIAQPQKEK